MSKKAYEWCIVPTANIRHKDAPVLKKFTWSTYKSNATAALMIYIGLILHINSRPLNNEDSFINTRMTYSEMEDFLQISRSKIAAGLQILEEIGLIQIESKKSGNNYKIEAAKTGWAKIPIKHLIDNDHVCKPFKLFTLRSRHELNSLKLYLLLIAFRSHNDNTASIKYENITLYTGINAADVSKAISHLVNLGLISVRNSKDVDDDSMTPLQGAHNIYKVLGLRSDPLHSIKG